MSNHNFNSIYNQHHNISTDNVVHDKERIGVPENIRMLERIGNNSSVDRDVGYTELQRDIITDSENKIYTKFRTSHDIGKDDPVNPLGDKGFDYRDYPDLVERS